MTTPATLTPTQHLVAEAMNAAMNTLPAEACDLPAIARWMQANRPEEFATMCAMPISDVAAICVARLRRLDQEMQALDEQRELTRTELLACIDPTDETSH